MDEELDQMTREELVAEVKKLRQGIRQHRDSTKHELCWHHPALWSLLPREDRSVADRAGVATVHGRLYSISALVGPATARCSANG
jgi:hypothetical protein